MEIKVIIMTLIICLIALPFSYAQISDNERSINAISLELKKMNNQTAKICSDAIVEYRAEVIRESQLQKEDTRKFIGDELRKQKGLNFIGVMLSSLIGYCAGTFIMSSLNKKTDEQHNETKKLVSNSKHINSGGK